MKKITLPVLFLILLIGAFYGGNIFANEQARYSSANGDLYADLVLYDMIQKKQISQAEHLLEGSIYINYNILSKDNRLDSAIKNGPMAKIAGQVQAKVLSNQNEPPSAAP